MRIEDGGAENAGLIILKAVVIRIVEFNDGMDPIESVGNRTGIRRCLNQGLNPRNTSVMMTTEQSLMPVHSPPI